MCLFLQLGRRILPSKKKKIILVSVFVTASSISEKKMISFLEMSSSQTNDLVESSFSLSFL